MQKLYTIEQLKSVGGMKLGYKFYFRNLCSDFGLKFKLDTNCNPVAATLNGKKISLKTAISLSDDIYSANLSLDLKSGKFDSNLSNKQLERELVTCIIRKIEIINVCLA